MSLEALTESVDVVAPVDDLIRQLDTCFMLGFSRLGAEQTEALAAVARVFTGTPLGERLKAAVEGVARAEFREEHFAVIGAARSALQGAQYDALLDAAAGALGRQRAPTQLESAPETPGPVGNWMNSTRQWLVEVALAGFLQLEHQTITPFLATLEQLQQQSEAARLSMLLTGLVQELLESIPAAKMDVVPERRWADLWCRAMTSAQALPAPVEGEAISGDLHILGVDLRHHTHAVSAIFYGVVEGGGGSPRFVRATASAYKVDVVTGDEMWQAFPPRFEKLFDAYSNLKTLTLDGMTLRGADLIWNPEQATLAKEYDIFDVCAQFLGEDAEPLWLPDVAPIDRHPVQLAIPHYTEDYKVISADGRTEIDLGEVTVQVDTERTSALSDLAEDAVMGTKKCFGLLRFDAGAWTFQPLAATKRTKPMLTGHGVTTERSSNSSIAILQERASKLLRSKS